MPWQPEIRQSLTIMHKTFKREAFEGFNKSVHKFPMFFAAGEAIESVTD